MDQSFDRLVVRSQPYRDESFLGYLLRLTQLNLYPSPAWILHFAKTKNSAHRKVGFVFDDEQDLSALSCLTSVDQPQLRSLLYSAAGLKKKFGNFLLFNNAIPSYLLRPSRPKVCPGCLQDSGYIRRIWDFALVTACPIHKQLLIDECPACHKRIPWMRSTLYRCQCEADWRDYSTQPLDDSQLAVSRQVHHLCGLNARTETREVDNSNPLYKKNLTTFTSCLLFVASQLGGGIDTKGKHFAPTRRNTERHELLCKALPIFSDWPNRFYLFLDERRPRPDPQIPPVTGATRGDTFRFPQYKSALFQQLPSSDYDFLRTAFSQYKIARRHQRLIASATTNNISGYLKKGNSRVNANEILNLVKTSTAQKILKIGPPGILRLIYANKIEGLISSENNRTVVLLEQTSLERFKMELVDSLCLTKVAALLGVTFLRVDRLVANGLLRPLRGPSVDGNKESIYRRKDVLALLATLMGKVSKGRRPPKRSKGILSFEAAMFQFGRLGKDIDSLLQLVLDDQIQPCSTNEKPGLMCLEFYAQEISAYIKDELQFREGAVLRVKEAARTLKTTVDTLHSLNRNHLLPARKSIMPTIGTLISKKDLDRFRAKYVFAHRIASEFGTTPGFLTKILRSKGIHPISGKDVDCGRSTIFRRSEIERVDLSQALTTAAIRRSQERRKPLDVKEAACRLEISKVAVHDLFTRGILMSDPRLRKRTDSELAFTREAVDKLRAQLSKFDGLLSTSSAARMLGTSVSSFREYYLQTGRMKPALALGRNRIYFRLRDVEHILRARNDRTNGTVTSQEAADICGVYISCVHKWSLAGVLKPIPRQSVGGPRRDLYLRSDVEKLHAKREAFKARRIKEGKTARTGRPGGPQRAPVQDLIAPRVEQLLKEWFREDPERRITGARLHRQLRKERYLISPVAVYDYLQNRAKHSTQRQSVGEPKNEGPKLSGCSSPVSSSRSLRSSS